MMPPSRYAVVFVALLACGCAGRSGSPVPVFEVARGPFEIRLEGHGELRAETSTTVEVPSRLPGMQRVAWLAEDGSWLEEGDLVADLDGERIRRFVRRARDEVRRLDLQIATKERQLARERQSVQGQIDLLEQERKDAETFAPRDAMLYSRHEIIDAELDRELLETKLRHFAKRMERYDARAGAKLEILRLQRRTAAMKLSQQESSLALLEVRAPHEGLFLRESGWGGEKVRVGSNLWSGQSLGSLPDLAAMEAKIFVLESEAAGLAVGLEAEVTLDSHPGQVFPGEVRQVQPVANPIDRQSPVKYFEVIVSLNETDSTIMRPGGGVTAHLYVERMRDVLSIPNQALFGQNEESWVWIDDGGAFERREVETGERSLSRTVVVSGLEAGECVALSRPGETL